MSRGPRRGGGCSTAFWILILVGGLIGYAVSNFNSRTPAQCNHEWESATCDAPETCSKCKITKGEKLEHQYPEVSCGETAACVYCGETVVLYPEHEWVAATCTEAEVCARCGVEGAAALGHNLVFHSCTKGDECSRCDYAENATEHTWVDATCTEPKTCTVCGTTSGVVLGHDYVLTQCGTAKECLTCEIDPADAPDNVTGHTFAEYDTDAYRTCLDCGATVEILFESGTEDVIQAYTEYHNDGSAPYTTFFYNDKIYRAQWEEKNGEMNLPTVYSGKPQAQFINGKVYYDLHGYERSEDIVDAMALEAARYVSFQYYMWTESGSDFDGFISLHLDPEGNGLFYEFTDEGRVYLAMDYERNPCVVIYKGEDWKNPDAVYVAKITTPLEPSN